MTEDLIKFIHKEKVLPLPGFDNYKISASWKYF